MKNDENDKNKNDLDPGVWTAFAVPGQSLAYILGGAALGLIVGHFIDDKFHSTPVATLIGLLLGLAVGIYGIYRLVTSLK